MRDETELATALTHLAAGRCGWFSAIDCTRERPKNRGTTARTYGALISSARSSSSGSAPPAFRPRHVTLAGVARVRYPRRRRTLPIDGETETETRTKEPHCGLIRRAGKSCVYACCRSGRASSERAADGRTETRTHASATGRRPNLHSITSSSVSLPRRRRRLRHRAAVYMHALRHRDACAHTWTRARRARRRRRTTLHRGEGERERDGESLARVVFGYVPVRACLLAA